MNIELLRMARSVIEGIPDDQLDLSHWVGNSSDPAKVVDHTCGTIACIGGWVAGSGLIPNLVLRQTNSGGAKTLVPWLADEEPPASGTTVGSYWYNVTERLAKVFGLSPDDAEALFSAAGDGEWDYDLEWDDLTHKQLALARFDYLLGHH